MKEHKNKYLGIFGSDDTPLGMGTWALGGPFFSGEKWLLPEGSPLGYGKAGDPVSIRALHRAIDLGASVIDTADAYGTGHSERVIARASRLGSPGDQIR